MIGAALQRRVYLSGQESAIHPNMFVVLTGTPGTGKSLVSSVIKALLTEQKYVRSVKVNGTDSRMVEIVRFPVAADSTTFQSLVEETAEAVSTHEVEGHPPYVHHSISFILDELASIFKQQAEDLTTFLLTVHGGHPYRRRIRDTGGRFSLERPCVSILGGTVVKKLRHLISDGTLDTGMASRMIFVFARKPRFREAFIPDRDDRQLAARLQLTEHLKKLHRIFGQIVYAPDALIYIRAWWKDLTRVKINKDPVLEGYYDRKALHLNKLCIVLLFCEQVTSNVITLDIVKQGISILDYNEQLMNVPLAGGRRNELFTIGIDILDFIAKNEKVTSLDLLTEFLPEATKEEINEILLTLHKQKEVNIFNENGQFCYTIPSETDRLGLQDQGGQVNAG